MCHILGINLEFLNVNKSMTCSFVYISTIRDASLKHNNHNDRNKKNDQIVIMSRKKKVMTIRFRERKVMFHSAKYQLPFLKKLYFTSDTHEVQYKSVVQNED